MAKQRKKQPEMFSPEVMEERARKLIREGRMPTEDQFLRSIAKARETFWRELAKLPEKDRPNYEIPEEFR